MLSSKYRSSWAQIFNRAYFCIINGPKKTYQLKPSIKLMLQPNRLTVDLNILKKTNQYNLTQINKLLVQNQKIISLGQAVSLIVDGEMSILSKDGYFILYDILDKFLNSPEQDLESLQIHDPTCLHNFIKVFQELQKNTGSKISNIFLTFIAMYCQKSTLISVNQREMLIHILSSRQYFTQFILNYIKHLKIDFQAPLKTHSDIYLVSHRIGIFNNLQKAYSSKLIPQRFYKPEDLTKLNEQFISLISDPTMISQICSMNPQYTFIEELLIHSEARVKYTEMFMKIFDPHTYPLLKLHPSILHWICRTFLLFYADQPNTVKIFVEKFMLCMRLYFNKQDSVAFPASITMLCDRYNFIVPQLREMIYEYHINILDSLQHNLYHKKSVFSFRSFIFRLYYILGVLYRSSSEPISETLRETYLSKIDYFFSPSNPVFDEIMEYFSSIDVAEIRNIDVTPSSEASFYQTHKQFIKNVSKSTHSIIKNLEKQLGVIKNELAIEDKTFPINLKTNKAARIKLLVWVLYFYAKFQKNPAKIEEAFGIITNNKFILERIQKDYWYPGLFEGFSLLFYAAEPHLPEGTVKKSISIYIKTQSQLFTRNFSKLLNKPYREKQLLESIKYSPYVENIQPTIEKNFDAYSPEFIIEMGLLQSPQLFYTKNSPNIRQKIQNQLRGFYSRHSRSNPIKVIPFYTEYPFITDFMVSTRSKNYAIFITVKGKQASQQFQEGEYLPRLQESSIEHFKKNCTVIEIDSEEDVKNISVILEKRR